MTTNTPDHKIVARTHARGSDNPEGVQNPGRQRCEARLARPVAVPEYRANEGAPVRLRRRITLGAASLLVGVGMVVAAETPAFAIGSGFVADVNGANVFDCPRFNCGYVGHLAYYADVTVFCQTTGDPFNGLWGWTNVWDRITSGTEAPEYVSDGYINTGSNGRVAPDCP
jgi:hypothetical protein